MARIVSIREDGDWIELRPRAKAIEGVLTREEFYRLFAAAQDHKDKIILALAIMGMRASEIAKITKDYVDLVRKEINVPEHIAKKRHGRTIPYGKFTRLSPIVDAYFFLNDKIGLSRKTVWARIKKIAKLAGIPKPVTPNGLRATGATLAASAGLSVQALRELFGWKYIQTAQYYIERAAGTASKELEGKEII